MLLFWNAFLYIWKCQIIFNFLCVHLHITHAHEVVWRKNDFLCILYKKTTFSAQIGRGCAGDLFCTDDTKTILPHPFSLLLQYTQELSRDAAPNRGSSCRRRRRRWAEGVHRRSLLYKIVVGGRGPLVFRRFSSCFGVLPGGALRSPAEIWSQPVVVLLLVELRWWEPDAVERLLRRLQ
jgi:hypothetical protein